MPIGNIPLQAIAPGRRISVVGCSGAGKSTLSRRLAQRLGYRHVELDALFHQPNWQPLPTEQFQQATRDALHGDGWIAEGNYSAVRPLVRERSDMVIWLDLPRHKVMRQVIWRTLRRLATHEELWNGNRERWGNLFKLIHSGLDLDTPRGLSAALQRRNVQHAALHLSAPGFTPGRRGLPGQPAASLNFLLRKTFMTLNIRPAVREDAALILCFITDLAIYEKAEHEVKTDVAGIENSLFGEGSTAHGLICELNGEPIGYAVYFFNYSTWLGKHGLYLEDLYITPQQRGVGAGKALLRHLAKLAVARGCGRFEWSVLDWNTPAIEFYDSIGAKPQNEWIGYRLTGEALTSFAAG